MTRYGSAWFFTFCSDRVLDKWAADVCTREEKRREVVKKSTAY
jgi:hypothetical protein